MKKNIFSLLLFSTLCLPLFAAGKEVDIPLEQANEDLKIILRKTFLHSRVDPFLKMIAIEAIQESGKEMDAEDLLNKFREAFTSPEMQAKLAAPYHNFFSVEEIRAFRKVKYSEQSTQVFQANFITIQETLKELALKHGTEIKARDKNEINIAKENQ